MYASPWLWLPLYSAGIWAALSLKLATSASCMLPLWPTPKLRAPLLRRHVETLKLNASAPYRRPSREPGKLLLLKR